MLIKARGVAGDEGLAAEFLEMIQPFRFPPSLSADVLREVAAVKDRIEKEVVGADELERNVKLGRGGIREIEFIVQSLQILHAGQAAVSADRANAAVPGQAGAIQVAGGGGGAIARCRLPVSARRRASPANGGKSADPHHSRRPRRRDCGWRG